MPASVVDALLNYTNAQKGESPYDTGIEGFVVLRSDHAKRPDHLLIRPSLCVTLQGAKVSTLGNNRCEYPAGKALVVSVEMPAVSQVLVASPNKPFLGVILGLDLPLMRTVLEGLEPAASPLGEAGQGTIDFDASLVVDFDAALIDCVLRLLRLLDTPQAIPELAPLIMREIHYWLLTGPQGPRIAKTALVHVRGQRVLGAVNALRGHFTHPLRVADLAKIANLSASAFHRQFKALTSMTPLQYQKQLRLLEARRLLVSDSANVESAAYEVGYVSPSQFSREYLRMFGAPPRRDSAALKSAVS